MYPQGVCRIRKPAYAGNGCAIFPVFDTEEWAEKIRSQSQTIYSYYFSIKWLTPFYPANSSQAAGSGEKCMDLRFLRLRRWLLKQQPNKTVFNRFIEN